MSAPDPPPASGPPPLWPPVVGEDRLKPLRRDELVRYHRNALVPEVGLAGQQRIRAARILLVGAGGLGSPAALYLAAAGTGHLGVVDDDEVDVSNLQRQVIHTTAGVGRPKVDSAAEALRTLNPDVEVRTYRERVTASNAVEVLRGWDLVIDGTDSFAARYVLNDAAVLLGLPLVHGAVLRSHGQVGVFDSRHGPCYRCLHPAPPPPGSVPSCAEAGVLGVLPGIIGAMQAAEALKLVVGGARPLIGRLLVVDAWGGRVREVPVSRNPECPTCGDSPSVTSLPEEPGTGSALCAPTAPPPVSAPETTVPSASTQAAASPTSEPVTGSAQPWPVLTVTPEWLREHQNQGEAVAVLDVREEVEVAMDPLPGAPLPGSHHIPLGEVVEHMSELDTDRLTVVVCAAGQRSVRVVEALRAAGYSGAMATLEGGVAAWRGLRDWS
ncbi:molybdopterin-synthase adenylyltransferase MoeB [Actinomyces wuliandei]|uniref:molybdopterin-synthase adenylyltransferase MoeB n=1 Tax=Actinomyces wuliandei TaxID=2057743 RepID=UPI000FD7F91E|nr:molybdopterin-synthase adenylyltransferase MoeB [Actinomyces wuliandei]